MVFDPLADFTRPERVGPSEVTLGQVRAIYGGPGTLEQQNQDVDNLLDIRDREDAYDYWRRVDRGRKRTTYPKYTPPERTVEPEIDRRDPEFVRYLGEAAERQSRAVKLSAMDPEDRERELALIGRTDPALRQFFETRISDMQIVDPPRPKRERPIDPYQQIRNRAIELAELSPDDRRRELDIIGETNLEM